MKRLISKSALLLATATAAIGVPAHNGLAEVLLGDGSLEVHVADGLWCSPTVHIEIRSPDPLPYIGDQLPVRRLIGILRSIVPPICPAAREFSIIGLHNEEVVFSGTSLLAEGDLSAGPQPSTELRLPTERREVVRQIQVALTDLGFDPGPIDGAFGSRTSEAISEFQLAIGTTATGQPSVSVLAALRAELGLPTVSTSPSGVVLAAIPPDSDEAVSESTPGYQAGTPGATTAEASGIALVGNEEVQTGIALWLLGQRTGLAQSVHFQQAHNLIRTEPEGYPAYMGSPIDPSAIIQHLVEIAAISATRPSPPDRIVMDLEASLAWPRDVSVQNPVLNVEFMNNIITNADLPETSPLAIRTLDVAIALQLGIASFQANTPFPLALPPEIANLPRPADAINCVYGCAVFEDQELILRVHAALANLVIGVPEDATRSNARTDILDGTMTIELVELIRRPRPISGGLPETVVHRWEPSANTGAQASVQPSNDLDVLAAEFAFGTEDGRLLHLTSNFASVSDISFELPSGRHPPNARNALDLITRTAALVSEDPDRALTNASFFELLGAIDQLERENLVGVGYQTTPRASQMNEIAWTQVLREAEPQLRASLSRRAPELPLAIRSKTLVLLGDYDFDLQGFPIQIDFRDFDYFGNTFDPDLRSSPPPGFEPFLPVEASQASDLLDALEVDAIGGRMIPARLDYTLEAVTPNAAGLVEYEYRFEALNFYQDLDEQAPLLQFAFDTIASAGPSPEAEVPNSIYETTAERILATALTLGGEPSDLERMAVITLSDGAGVRNPTTSQLNQEMERLRGEKLSEFWLALNFRDTHYNREREEFVVDNRTDIFMPFSSDPTHYLRGIINIDLYLEGDAEIAPIPVSRGDMEEIIARQNTDRVFTMLWRVRPVAADVDRLLFNSLAFSGPSEILIGPRDPSGNGIQSVVARIVPEG